MNNDENGPVHMRRVDPARNMRRFYTLAIQPTLFGGATLVRNWGRIGTNGKSKMETFDRPGEASGAFMRLARTKRRRGYEDS